MSIVFKIKTFFLLTFCFIFSFSNAQEKTWVDSLDAYAREDYMPPKKYRWTWQRAAFLHSMVYQSETAAPDKRQQYLDYTQKAIDNVYFRANGKSPNAVASGLGTAYLARALKSERYKKAADKVFADYLKVKRADNGGITHKAKYKELWDDTIYMIGIFLQQMYLLTGDEQYIDQLMIQIDAHHEKLSDPKTGLWYHGWDGDDKNRCNFCGQTGWSNNPEKRSNEFWGRGNGWVVVTLAQTLKVLPKEHPHRAKAEAYLKEMIQGLPAVQDKATGHWFQLPMRPEQAGNYIESSCTAMFAYGILVGLEEGVVEGLEYQESVQSAYAGLRTYSIKELGKGYLTTKNVCKGTCIGDMQYYLDRKAASEKPSGIGMFILFGRAFENSSLK